MVGNGKVAVRRKGSAMQRKAFTLIELLVVIAIIVLLVAIIAPAMSTMIARGRAGICQNHLRHLGEAFGLSITSRGQKTSGQVIGGNVSDVYPPAMLWPGIPMDASPKTEIYQCPEEDGVVVSLSQSLANLEYQSPHGNYPLDVVGEGNCYKSRRGSDPQGAYTEFLMQDDEGTGGQYALMDFNGWIDTDGGMRIYDSGKVHIFQNLEVETADSVPDWLAPEGTDRGGGWPTGINTCPNMNNLLWNGLAAFDGDPKMQNHKGEQWQMPNWGDGTNYGISSLAYKHSFGSTVIVLVDYEETIVNLDTPLDSQNLLVDSARHLGKINYLKADGSVESATPLEISPVLQPKKWAR